MRLPVGFIGNVVTLHDLLQAVEQFVGMKPRIDCGRRGPIFEISPSMG